MWRITTIDASELLDQCEELSKRRMSRRCCGIEYDITCRKHEKNDEKDADTLSRGVVVEVNLEARRYRVGV